MRIFRSQPPLVPADVPGHEYRCWYPVDGPGILIDQPLPERSSSFGAGAAAPPGAEGAEGKGS